MKCSSFVIILVLVAVLSAGSVAADNEDMIPEDFNFSYSSVCSQYDYFHQAYVCEDGSFAILAPYTNMNENPDLVFTLWYVDLYDATGTFCAEYTFYTRQSCAVELSEHSLIIYLPGRVISYDLSKNTLVGRFEDQETVLENISKLRSQTAFQAGDWHYVCESGFHGYRSLTRSNDSTSEMLISLSGGKYNWKNTLGVAIIVFFLCTILRVYIRKSKNNKTHKAGGSSLP